MAKRKKKKTAKAVTVDWKTIIITAIADLIVGTILIIIDKQF